MPYWARTDRAEKVLRPVSLFARKVASGDFAVCVPAWQELKKTLQETLAAVDFVDRVADQSRRDVDLRKTRMAEKLLQREAATFKVSASDRVFAGFSCSARCLCQHSVSLRCYAFPRGVLRKHLLARRMSRFCVTALPACRVFPGRASGSPMRTTRHSLWTLVCGLPPRLARTRGRLGPSSGSSGRHPWCVRAGGCMATCPSIQTEELP